jgi:hypothetical protein
MLATTTHPSKSHPLPLGFAPGVGIDSQRPNQLKRADFSRDARLLDASVAGIVLSFNPRDQEMRESAERSWQIIRGLLADNLFADATGFLPWTGDGAAGSATAKDILKKRYSELRSLARTVASASFEHGSDAEIAGAGKALCRLAVKLDDLMDGTERRLVTALRAYVFSSGEETRLSA